MDSIEHGQDQNKNTLIRRFTTAFAVMFIIPMLVSIYLLFYFSFNLETKTVQIISLIFFCLILGIAGFMILRSIVKSIMGTVNNMRAVVSGDFSKRINEDAHSEISDLARNFNNITEKLQLSVSELEKSKAQVQKLLNLVSQAVESPLELDRLLSVYLSSIIGMLDFNKGIITTLTPEGDFKIIANVGFNRSEVEIFLEKADEVLRSVIEAGRPLSVVRGSQSNSIDRFKEFIDFTGDSISVPLIKSQKTIGALTISMGKIQENRGVGVDGIDGKKKLSIDDIFLLQNLAAQITVALENADLRDTMEQNYFESIAALAAAVEARDKYTKGHSARVTEFSEGIAREMGVSEDRVKTVRDAALLHDIGKIGIPDTILHNPAPSLPLEWVEVIRTHPVIGENIIKPLNSLKRLCPGVRHHHERYSGEGYPDGLKGDAIPLEARIMSVADAFDAMTSERSYRKNLTKREALQELVNNAGTQFDPECVKAFIHLLKKQSSSPSMAAS
jgi:HD-GYP domain-containing protein (c-di-GMP phosphodiesterase class II)/HAMP domain-containing protein